LRDGPHNRRQTRRAERKRETGWQNYGPSRASDVSNAQLLLPDSVLLKELLSWSRSATEATSSQSVPELNESSATAYFRTW